MQVRGWMMGMGKPQLLGWLSQKKVCGPGSRRERRARQQTRHQATHCASCESCWPVFLLLHRFSSHTPFLFIYLPSPHLYLLKVLPFERAKWMFFRGVVIGNNLQRPAPRFEFGSPFHFKHKAPTYSSPTPLFRGAAVTLHILHPLPKNPYLSRCVVPAITFSILCPCYTNPPADSIYPRTGLRQIPGVLAII